MVTLLSGGLDKCSNIPDMHKVAGNEDVCETASLIHNYISTLNVVYYVL